MPSITPDPQDDRTFPERPRPWWGLLALAVPLVTGLLLSWHSLGDLDIWFHLRAGRDLLDGQGVSAVNRYSFTEPDHPWLNHEWLFQVGVVLTGPDPAATTAGGEFPSVTGWNLLRAFLTGSLLLVLLLGDGGRDRFGGRDGPVAAAWSGLPVVAGLFLLWPRLTLRPELISYLLFVLLLRGVERYLRLAGAGSPATPPAETGWRGLVDPREPAGRILWITLLWAQFHGFASLAVLVLGLALALAPVQRRLFDSSSGSGHPSVRTGGGLLILTLVMLAVTPNGPAGLLMPLRALGQFATDRVDLRTTVSELVPLPLSPNSLGLTIALFKVSLLWSAGWIVATWGRVSLLRILVFGLAAAAAWTNQRSIGFYAIAFVLLHTGAGPGPWRFSAPAAWLRQRPVPVALTGTVLTLLAAALWWPPIIRDDFYLREGVGRRFGAGTNPARYPVAAAADLAGTGAAPFFANLDAAAFLLAHTTGPIYIDGRTEAYSADLWREYLDIKRGDRRALDLLASRRPQAVCLATAGGAFDQLATALLASPTWELATAEDAGLLFRPAAAGTPERGPRPHALLTAAAEGTLGSLAGSATRRADLCLAAGQLFGFAGNEAARERAYRRGLALRADHPPLNHNLGNQLLARQEFPAALAHFQNALAVNPRLAGSALNAGVCLMRLGRPREAAERFRRAAGIDPRRPEAWANLAAAHIAGGDLPGAIEALEKAVDLRPDDPRLRQRLRELKRGAD